MAITSNMHVPADVPCQSHSLAVTEGRDAAAARDADGHSTGVGAGPAFYRSFRATACTCAQCEPVHVALAPQCTILQLQLHIPTNLAVQLQI